LQCSASDGFSEWLSLANGSVLITTYQADKVVLAGWNGRRVSILARNFPKPMGAAVEGDRVAITCRDEVCFLANAPRLAPTFPPDRPVGYDAVYLPRATYVTGNLDVHDIAFGSEGLWIVNTEFSCLALLSQEHSFVPRWHPPFVSALLPEDRCHLNGLAVRDGRPGLVTAMGCSDTPGGWRQNRQSGGVLIDVESGEVALEGLCMPHSPRFHEGKCWLLNSGTGELWLVDAQRRRHEVVCALPGYLRGLSFAGHFALVGMSQIRESHAFDGMPVQKRFDKLMCGAALVDLPTGRLVGSLEFTSGCTESYDVQFLPGVRRPTILNPMHPFAHKAVVTPESCHWAEPEPGEPGQGDGGTAR
jgi:uncharacterized protein (TIGR03032 family)